MKGEFIIISRRDKRRVGMRFMSRGVDSEGNASNFAQTEQIFNLDNNTGKSVFIK